ncbi:MAG: SH3 domain-containing protein [Chloroflexota bacterium]
MRSLKQGILLILAFFVVSPLLIQKADAQTFARPILIVNTGFLNVRSGPSASFGIVATVAGGTELSVLGTAGDSVWYQVAIPSAGVGWVNIEFTIPRGDFTNVPLVETTAQPSNSAPVVVPATGTTGTAGTAGTTPVQPATGGTAGVDFIPVVPVDGSSVATLEQGGGPSADPSAFPGTVLISPEIAPVNAVSGAVVVVNTSALNVRSGPGAQYAEIQTVAGGTELAVTGVTPDVVWYRVSLGNRQGWVASEFVLFRGDPVAVPVVSYESVEGVAQLNQPIVIVNTSFLNVRSGPGGQFTTVFTARGGAEFVVLGLASDGIWYLVSTPAGNGWVNSEFVLFRGLSENVPIVDLAETGGIIEAPVAVISNSVQAFAAPGADFGLLGTINGPIEVPIVARTSEFDWIQVNTASGFGWVQADQIFIRGDASLIPIVAN